VYTIYKKQGEIKMNIQTAKKIATKNGICYSNAFDLKFVIDHTRYEGHETIILAYRRILKYILTGK